MDGWTALSAQYNSDRSKAVLLLWIIYLISVLFLLCFRARLFINALWSPAGKGLISWASFVMANFSIGILGQVCCFIVSISDLCPPPYFDMGAYLSLSKEQH